ncbi:MAG: ComF family protein [Chlorobiaceae bacterium]|nr:ComF family protein [Chlorobiaceae bacterium]
MLEGFAHLLFPEVCIVCRKPLESRQEPLCAVCFSQFTPFPDSLAGGQALIRTVRDHFGERAVPSEAWALYPYHSRGVLHDAMHAMKYGGLFPLGGVFGRRLGALVRSLGSQVGLDAIVPVPLHSLKRIERTYNQAEEIAAGIAGVLGMPVWTQCIERCVNTSSQTGLSLSDRRRNMDGAFRPGRKACRGKVLLVDDVLTTGATMVAAAAALKESGAAAVAFATVAVTEKE